MLNQLTIQNWLVKKKSVGFVQHLLLGVFALLVGIVVVFVTFWFSYAIIWFGWHGVSAISELFVGKKLHLGHHWRLVLSGLFVVGLFLQHFRTSPWYWGDYPKDYYVSAPGFQAHGGVVGGLGFMLAYPGASANMIADILLTGPRLLTGAFGLVKRAFRLRQLDAEGCARLLEFLWSKPELVSYADLESAGWEPWFADLRLIDGVQFLKKGLVLSEELRAELAALN